MPRSRCARRQRPRTCRTPRSPASRRPFLNVRGPAVRARRHAPGLCLALQRPRHRLSRAPGLRPRAGRALGRRPAHGPQRPRRERRDVHARHRVRLPRRRLHHRVLGPRRNGRAGRGESRRVLRLQAGAARRQARDHPPQPRLQGVEDDLRRNPAPGRWVETVDVAAADRARFCISDADAQELARQALVDRGPLRLPDGHRVGQGRRDRRNLRAAGAARDGPEPERALDPALHAEDSARAPSPAAARSASASAQARRASLRARGKCRASSPATCSSPT